MKATTSGENTIIFADVRGVKSTDVRAATVPPCCHVPMLSISHVPMQWAPIRITPVYNSSVSRYCVIHVCVCYQLTCMACLTDALHTFRC